MTRTPALTKWNIQCPINEVMRWSEGALQRRIDAARSVAKWKVTAGYTRDAMNARREAEHFEKALRRHRAEWGRAAA